MSDVSPVLRLVAWFFGFRPVLRWSPEDNGFRRRITVLAGGLRCSPKDNGLRRAVIGYWRPVVGLSPVSWVCSHVPLPKGRHTAARQRVKAARQFLGWSPAGSRLENPAILGVGHPPVLKGMVALINNLEKCLCQPGSQPASQPAKIHI